MIRAPPYQKYIKFNLKENKKLKNETANRIVALRTAAGMSRQAFCEYFGFPYRTLQDWELDNRKYNDYLVDLMEYKLRNEGMMGSVCNNEIIIKAHGNCTTCQYKNCDTAQQPCCVCVHNTENHYVPVRDN